MKFIRYILILCLIFFTISCSTINVDYDYDPGASFASYKYYDWFPVPKKNVKHELVIKQIKNEMENQMESRGFIKSSESPDFMVAFHGGIQQFLTYDDFKYLREQYEPYWARRRIDFSHYDPDTFIIDFIDTKTKTLFYRGIVTAFIMEPTADKREKAINEFTVEIINIFQMIQSK